jgi:biotin carboxylase
MESPLIRHSAPKPIPLSSPDHRSTSKSPPSYSWSSKGFLEAGSWSSAEYGRPGSTAELTSLIVSNLKQSPAAQQAAEGLPSMLQAEMNGQHSGSRASLCSYVSEQLVGSGRGSVAEMTSLIVSEMNPATEEQLWRQQSVAGSVIVFVSAGYEGKRFVYEIAHQMELSTVIIDEPDSWTSHLTDEGVIEKFIPMIIDDSDESFHSCVKAITEVKESLGRLDAILSFCELTQTLVARLAAHFKVPGNPVEAVLAARDKYKSREALQNAGLPSPKFFIIRDPEHCEDAAAHVGFPAVIKPIFGVASIGVVRVDDLPDLKQRVNEVRDQMLHARVINGALFEGTEDDPERPPTGADAAHWIDLTIMMEEYLDGPEVDIDVIISDGVSYYEALTDNWPTVEPYFNETGSNCPSILPAAQQQELRVLAGAAIKHLGLRMGVFHVEAKYTTKGPRLIEVNCRMGGGPVQLINRLVYGVDLVVEQLILSCGGDPLPRVEHREPLCNLAEYSMNCPRTGYIAHTRFLDEWQSHPRLVYARPLVQPRQRVVGPDGGMPTWLCEVMCTAASVEEGIQFVKDIEKRIQFPIVDVLPPDEAISAPCSM